MEKAFGVCLTQVFWQPQLPAIPWVRRIFTENAEIFKNTESSIKSVRRAIKALWGQKKSLDSDHRRPNKKLSIRSIHSIHSKRHPQRLFRIWVQKKYMLRLPHGFACFWITKPFFKETQGIFVLKNSKKPHFPLPCRKKRGDENFFNTKKAGGNPGWITCKTEMKN